MIKIKNQNINCVLTKKMNSRRAAVKSGSILKYIKLSSRDEISLIRYVRYSFKKKSLRKNIIPLQVN